jgi:uncharacterized protein YdaU (DUF1376 family)
MYGVSETRRCVDVPRASSSPPWSSVIDRDPPGGYESRGITQQGTPTGVFASRDGSHAATFTAMTSVGVRTADSPANDPTTSDSAFNAADATAQWEEAQNKVDRFFLEPEASPEATRAEAKRLVEELLLAKEAEIRLKKEKGDDRDARRGERGAPRRGNPGATRATTSRDRRDHRRRSRRRGGRGTRRTPRHRGG